ncbi:hypothetical protein DL93DRAFT_2072013 [Clavulina sp. PMI_390]|nr:hypothetical protein DL93DRAFT_2072013 [Clavulina sp. PMI_390]
MHHRRNSSLAVIDRSIPSDIISSSADSEKHRISLVAITEQDPIYSSSSSMSTLRRRLRPLAILLAVGTLFLLLLLSGFFNASSGLRVAQDSSRIVVHDRPYPPALAPGRIPPHGDAYDDERVASNPYKGKGNGAGAASSSSAAHQGKPLKLTTDEELGALVAYLTSLGAHATIPDSIDPAKPIDAELILGFNTRSAKAAAEVKELVAETWEIHPVVMFGQARQPTTKALKLALDMLNLHPKPTMIFLDEREDESRLGAIVQRLTGAKSFPVTIVGGRYIGSVDEVLVMASNGELRELLAEAGATVTPKKGKGK